MLYLHMYLSNIIATSVYCLNQKFFNNHLTSYDLLDRFYGSIYWPIAEAEASNFSPAISSPTFATLRIPSPEITCR